MSSILKFPLERVQRRSYGMPDISHNAEVLVFEGVRYEKNKSSKVNQSQKKALAAKVKIKP